jgi:hypothetical protein
MLLLLLLLLLLLQVKNPAVDMPVGIVGCISFVTVVYCAMALCIVMMVPYNMVRVCRSCEQRIMGASVRAQHADTAEGQNTPGVAAVPCDAEICFKPSRALVALDSLCIAIMVPYNVVRVRCCEQRRSTACRS